MRPKLESCPSAEQLDRLIAGTLPDAEAEALAAHIDSCATCRRSVEGAPRQAAWADDIRWADRQRDESQVEVGVPLAKLNELIPDYEVLAEIGRGGMGIVYRARQKKLDRIVALKVLPALLGVVRPEASARFRREAALAARLKHTSIIAVHDFGEIDGTMFYAMELVEGRSLRDVLREINEAGATSVVAESSGSASAAAGSASSGSGSRSTIQLGSSAPPPRAYYRQVAKWMADVAEALQHAHALGVIHRDIKPSNLLLGNDGRLLIADFGLARSAARESMTASRALLGTVRYMSPEQVDTTVGPVDARADVYGLGATMYELLAFRPMFSGSDDREVLNDVLNREPPPPHKFIRQVPRELETICLKALEKDRKTRYQSAQEMTDDLRRWLLDMPIHAHRPGLIVRAGKFIKRRKLTVALSAACVVLLIGGSAIYASYAVERRRASSERIQLVIETAQRQLNSAQSSEAIDTVRRGLAIDPESTSLRLLEAKALIDSGQHITAMGALDQLLQRRPDCADGHYLAALLVADRSRLIATREVAPPGEQRLNMPPDERRRLLVLHRDRVKQLAPDANALNILVALTAANAHEAIEHLNRCLERDPSRIDALQLRAETFDRVRDYPAMLLDTERIRVLRPDDVGNLSLHARALSRLGRLQESERAESAAIELQPANPMHWVNRAITKNALGNFAAAVADADQAIRLNVEFDGAYGARAAAYCGIGKYDLAITDLKQASRIKPRDITYALERGRVHLAAGEFEHAISAATQAVEIAPKDPRAYELRARAFIQLGRCDRAIADLSHQVDLSNVRPFVYRNRAAAFRACGQLPQAINDLTTAIRLDGGTLDDFIERSMLYIQSGQRDRAIGDLSRLIDEERLGNGIRLRRGALYELIGDHSAALKDYVAASSDDGPIGEYARLWTYLLLRLEPEAASAPPMLDADRSEASRAGWPGKVRELLRGNFSPNELLAAAATKAERAEAHYYIGARALLESRLDDARRAFADCIRENSAGTVETDFARARLAQLDRKHADKPAESDPSVE